VVKIEPPGGDPLRAYPELFASVNANKRSVVLDLKSDAGRRRALELAAEAEVVVEGFRPGVAARLGVGYDQVRPDNPAVVYCSLSGMGQDGPLALAPGHDLNYQAWAGVLAPDGGPPVVPAVPVADLAGGMAAAFGICAAVLRSRATGEGEYIDLAMTDVLATWTGAVTPRAAGTTGTERGVPGYGTFACADGGHLVLGVLTEDHFWRPLCRSLDLTELVDLTFPERTARTGELQARIAGAVALRERDALVAELLAVDVPVAPVQDRAQMLGTEHFAARGVVTADPWADPATGYPVRFRAHPAARTDPPPGLDEHRGAGFGQHRATAPGTSPSRRPKSRAPTGPPEGDG
jgi:crotonobetainyl-CoA:carnitine CoA-transferase CaiB-like acyl-CoA transferase